jgi:endogenous inhibitor of DNA gyrase (YacG/DUF329 family)
MPNIWKECPDTHTFWSLIPIVHRWKTKALIGFGSICQTTRCFSQGIYLFHKKTRICGSPLTFTIYSVICRELKKYHCKNLETVVVLTWDNKFSYSINRFNSEVDIVITFHKVSCPKCGKELAKPDRKLENSVFYVALFTCDTCGTKVKFSTEF